MHLSILLIKLYGLRMTWRVYCKIKTNLKMFKDSKQLFDVMSKASYPTEKKLIIDVPTVRKSYNSFEISNLGLISGTNNPNDALITHNF